MVISMNDAFLLLWDKATMAPHSEGKRYERLLNKLASWELNQIEVDYG